MDIVTCHRIIHGGTGMKELDFLYDKRGENDPYDRTGKSPLPLRSSWNMHERAPLPPRPEKLIYYLDDMSGNSISQYNTLPDAERARKEFHRCGHKVVIRPFVISEESLQDDTSYRKWKSQHGHYSRWRYDRENLLRMRDKVVYSHDWRFQLWCMRWNHSIYSTKKCVPLVCTLLPH